MSTLSLEVARAFKPLLRPARYKGAYGGRGGAKSHFFAEQLIVRCYSRPTRAVCIREVQLSLRDSVRQLLIDKIQKLGLGAFFAVTESEIRGANSSLIIFRGMQSYNAETIKSLEGFDIAWVEEAQTLSAKSLELLRPTLRADDSEIWFSWNPRHRTDPVDVFFRKHPPPDAVAAFVNWRDNPWFPPVLRKEMEHDRSVDPELAEHVWDGGYGVTHGAILARLVDRAEREGRIGDQVAYDPDGPGLDVVLDIGFRDTTAAWFLQRRVGGRAWLLFDEASGLDAAEWCSRIRDRIAARGYRLGTIWLPHDARNRTFNSRLSAMEIFLKAFGPRVVRIVPDTKISDRVNAARLTLPKSEFHVLHCAAGLEALREWSFEWNEENRAFAKTPKHDWASHAADAYSYGCVALQEFKLPPPPKKPEPLRGVERITVDELTRMTDTHDRTWA